MSAALPQLAPPKGSRIVIAGGCGGIGRAVVQACLAAEHRVFVLDLAASIERHPPPAGAACIAIDASDESSVEQAYSTISARAGGLDGMVNLCGYKLDTLPIANTPAQIFDDGIAGNLRSAFLLSRASVPLLQQAGGGCIVHVTSGLGSYGGSGYGPYAIAKGGINTENAPLIRANAVAPGLVDTAFTRGGTGRSAEDGASSVDMPRYLQQLPLGRVATAADIVGPILFLLGPASHYITGQILHVNGGGYLP
jgi:3-oxoacyl-[acyl-carrier protein] reductase